MALMVLATSKASLEIRLMEVQGNVAGALAKTRAIQLASMDESLRATQELIYAEEDLLKVRSEALTQAQDAATRAMSVLQKAVDTEKKI
jgi:hypothetical protein